MFETSSIFYTIIIGIAVLLWLMRDKSLSRKTGIRPNLIIQDTAKKENTMGNDLQPLIQAYLTEFEVLRDEQLKRVEFSNQVYISSILLLSAVIPLVEYVDFVKSNGGDAYILFLLAALIFCTFGFYQLDLDNKFADLDNYILLVLTPNLKKILESQVSKAINLKDILGWHIYWRTTRYRSAGGLWLSIGVVGKTGIAVLGASVLLGSYIYFEHIVLGVPWYLSRILFVSGISFGIVWMIIAGALVRNNLAKATKFFQASVDHT